MHRFKPFVYIVAALILVVLGVFLCSTQISNAQSDSEDSNDPVTDIYLNDYPEFTTTGIQIDGIGSGTINYNVPTADADEDHTITITSIGPASVTFTLSATPAPMAATLQQNETRQFDVNADGNNDIEIGLRDIEDSLANMSFKQVVPASIARPRPVDTGGGNSSSGSTGTSTTGNGTTTGSDGTAVNPTSAGAATGEAAKPTTLVAQVRHAVSAPWQVYLAVTITVIAAIVLYNRWRHRRFLKALFETHWPNNDPDLR